MIRSNKGKEKQIKGVMAKREMRVGSPAVRHLVRLLVHPMSLRVPLRELVRLLRHLRVSLLRVLLVRLLARRPCTLARAVTLHLE